MLSGLKQLRLDGLKQQLQNLASGRGPDQIEGERLLDQGDYQGAELCLAKALLDSEKRRLPNDIRIQIRLELAEAQRRQFSLDGGRPQPRKLDAAEESCRAALELARHHGDKGILVQCLDPLSRTLADRGDLEGVEALLLETNEIERHAQRPDALAVAQRLHRLAALRRQCGQVSSAIPPLEQAAATVELLRGPDHLETADLLTELGESYRFLGQHATAQKHLKRALWIHEQECGLGSAEAAHDLNLLTGSYESSGDLDSAAAEHERVLALQLRGLGANLEQLAESQFSLAQLHLRWGNPSRARELLTEAIGTFKRSRGPRLAVACEALADVEEKGGRLREALLQLTDAGRVWEGLQPAHAREWSRNLQCQVQILERLHEEKDALFIRERLAEIGRASDWAQAS